MTTYAGSDTSNRTWSLADERGSVVGLADGTRAALVNRYDEYGVPATGNAGRFQYTGQIWLPEAGLYHYRARAYVPQIGRFLQADPFGYAAGQNLYAYVEADPVNLVDPLGLIPGGDDCAPDPEGNTTCLPTVLIIGSSCSIFSTCVTNPRGPGLWHPGDFEFHIGGRSGGRGDRPMVGHLPGGFTEEEKCMLRALGGSLLSAADAAEGIGHTMAVSAVAVNVAPGAGQVTSATLLTTALGAYGLSSSYNLAGAILLAAGGDYRRAMTELSFRLFSRLSGGGDAFIENVGSAVLNNLGDMLPEPTGCSSQ